MSGAPKGDRDVKSDVAGGSGDEDLHGGGLSFRRGDPVDGTNGDESPEKLAEIARGIGDPEARRHIFLCCDQTKPKCSERDRSIAAWDYLKTRLKELGLSTSGRVQRNKANCLRDLRRRPHRRRLSRGRLVPRVRPARPRADHPGASRRRAARRGVRVRHARPSRGRRDREPSRRQSCPAAICLQASERHSGAGVGLAVTYAMA